MYGQICVLFAGFCHWVVPYGKYVLVNPTDSTPIITQNVKGSPPKLEVAVAPAVGSQGPGMLSSLPDPRPPLPNRSRFDRAD